MVKWPLPDQLTLKLFKDGNILSIHVVGNDIYLSIVSTNILYKKVM